MGYLSKGYYIICLSAFFSFILYLVISKFFTGTEFFEAMFLGLNISIIGIQACGIALCTLGYKKHETIESFIGYKRKDPLYFDIHLSLPLTFLLMIWGGGIVYLAYFTVFSGQPHEKLMWMSDPVALTESTVRTFKGIIGVVSGLIFTIKLLLRKPIAETSMKD
jgi:hypothetical protein